MAQHYQFSGLKRRQFSFLLLFSLMLGFAIGTGILTLLVNILIFKLGFNGHTNGWLMPVIFGSTFFSAILVASVLVKLLSRFIKKVWLISFNSFEISVDETGRVKNYFLISQLERVTIFKTKTLMGFNQAIQLKFGDKIIDVQIVISPILSSSTLTDKVQFLAFIEFLFEHILATEFKQSSTNNILSDIASLLANENLIEYKYIFERKASIF